MLKRTALSYFNFIILYFLKKNTINKTLIKKNNFIMFHYIAFTNIIYK